MDQVDPKNRPEAALLGIRSGMGLYANLRPAKLFPQLAEASPLKPSIVAQGIDFLVVRELIGGVYFGNRYTREIGGQLVATDEMTYGELEVERIARVAFDTARKRRSKVTSIDKANVLDSSASGEKFANGWPRTIPMWNLKICWWITPHADRKMPPPNFDVVVTENMFGDILSDEASMITGSIGMIPSSSLGKGTRGMYEPIHGSAPDIAGQNLANPIGTILSGAMMLKYSFDMDEEAAAIEAAVNAVLDDGYRTGDMMSEGMKRVSCSEMGDLIAAKLKKA